MKPSKHSRLFVSLVSTLTASMVVVGPGVGPAAAAPPAGQFLNPDEDGPGNVISDKPDGTDGRYHFVLRLRDPEGLDDIQSVEIQIEDGDANTTFETIGVANRVQTTDNPPAGTDTWELRWDLSAHAPASDVNNDPGAVRAAVFTHAEGGPTFVPSAAGDPVEFRDQAAETVEITSPPNGDALGFFDADGDGNRDALIQGTASSGITTDEEIELFYTTQADPAVEPVWVDCEEGVVVRPNGWRGFCELSGGATPAQVTAVAVRTDDDNASGETGDESGDAHRVFGYLQAANALDVVPAEDTETIGFCNTYTVSARDQRNRPILGAPIDVHATGPADDLQFAANGDDPDDPDETSDPFAAPLLLHTSEPAAGCDQQEASPDAPDDNDSNSTGQQGEHENLTGADTKHIEGRTDLNGFQFSLDSETAGATGIRAWFDADDDEAEDTGEPAVDAAKTWVAAAAANVNAVPETDSNATGATHTVRATVTDENGNPVPGQRVHFRVTSGPHADDNLDEFVSTPRGYFGSCETDANGRCSQSYTGDEAGTDTITVWVNAGQETAADPSGTSPAFTPDADDRKDTVSKTWVPEPTVIDCGPENATNQAGANHSITCTVTDAFGNPVQGANVDFRVVAGPHADDDLDANDGTPPGYIGESTTDQTGQASTFYGGKETRPNRGNDVIDAWIDRNDNDVDDGDAVEGDGGDADEIVEAEDQTDEGERSDYVDKTWTPGAPVVIVCSPETSTNVVREQHPVTCVVQDLFGNPTPGVNVDFRVVAGPHADDDLDGSTETPGGYFGEGGTDADGSVTRSYIGTETAPNGGNDVIDGWIDTNDSDTDDGDDVEGDGPDADQIVEAEDQTDEGEPSDYVDKTWKEPPVEECPGYEGDPRNDVVGSQTRDRLVGTPGPDIMCGLARRDVLIGRGGHDLILGGGGDDEIRGADGNDDLRGGRGNDEIAGGDGADTLRGQAGHDELYGNAGRDRLIGGPGSDLCRGGRGRDSTRGCER
ncbi:MAG TPA: Ig-like domain-containing protein [Actinomycetota bacterium]|nr:Ig-like domain-containing protein [Actinomycetota bacterium]